MSRALLVIGLLILFAGLSPGNIIAFIEIDKGKFINYGKYYSINILSDGKIEYLLKKEKFTERIEGLKVIRVEGENKLKAKINIFKGKTGWKRNLRAYKSVILKGKDLKINLVLREGRVEKIIRLSKAKDISRLRFKIEGAKDIYKDKEGNLVVNLKSEKLIFTSPIAFQKGKKVAVAYWIRNNFYGFKIKGEYDPESPITIDPLLQGEVIYASYNDSSADIEIDDQGFIYITGTTYSYDFPVSSTAVDQTRNGWDAFIAKFDPNFNLVSATYIGGSQTEYGKDIAISGNSIYIVGDTDSGDMPGLCDCNANPNCSFCSFQASRPYNSNDYDCFVLKLTKDLDSILGGTLFRGSAHEYCSSVNIDSSGNVYIGGRSNSTDIPLANPIQNTLAGGYDIILAKFTPDLSNLLFSTYLGGDGVESLSDAEIRNNTLYITGYTNSSNFPTTSGVVQPLISSAPDVFVSIIDTVTPQLSASTHLGGTSLDYSNAIEVDQNGDIYVAGKTKSFDFPVTSGAYQTVNKGGYSWGDGFITKLRGDLKQILASTYIGSRSDEEIYDIKIDGDGNIVGVGHNYVLGFPVTRYAFMEEPPPGDNGIVFKISGDLTTLIYSTYYGGSNDDLIRSLVLDSQNNIYVTGKTTSSDIPVTTQPSSRGFWDVFVAKFDPTLSNPAIYTNVSRLDFGNTKVGKESNVKTINVINRGPYPLKIINVFTEGSKGFMVKEDLCTGKDIPQGSSCSLKISFKPKEKGSFKDILKIESNDPKSNLLAIELNGYGSSPQIYSPSTNINLGVIEANKEYIKEIPIINKGDYPLTISNVTVSDPVIIYEDKCSGKVIQPETGCIIRIKVKPTRSGNIKGTILVSSDDENNNPFLIELTATVVSHSIEIKEDSCSLFTGTYIFICIMIISLLRRKYNV